ncbi:glycine C-acetyltransferase [bacterium]|nr:glycine C-acetyltransferase [bacterium]
MPDKFRFIDEETKRLADEGLLIRLRTMESAPDGWMVVDGRRVLNFCTNNYLGLANDARLKRAAKDGIDRFGVGPAAVRSIAGTQTLHVELERKLAAFKGVEDALFVQSGFCANQAVIPALVGKEDAIFSDALNHASIIDGARLSRAKVIVFDHADPADFDRKAKEHAANFRRTMLISDGVFSMDGDIAPLPEYYEVAERHGCVTMVDDAHGEGVLGGGRGIVHHFGLAGKIDVEVGTLSKAFGVVGGVVAGSKRIVDFLRQKARPFLFSSATTPADTAACSAAVDILAESSDLVDRLWANADDLKDGLRALGFDLGKTATPIVPIMLGDAKLAQRFSARLFEEGLFAMAIGFPTVPPGLARIRVMNTAAHTREDLDRAIAIFAKVGRELGVIA